MRLEKTKQIIQLIDMMKTSSIGISLNEIADEFNMTYRSAQRLIAVVTDPDLALGIDEYRDFDNKKRWKIPFSARPKNKYDLTTDDFATLYQISKMMKTKNASGLNKKVTEILCKLKANTDERKLSVIENSMPDYMEVEQELFFPYCREINEQKLDLLRKACSTFHKVQFETQGQKYIVEPYGINSSATQVILISKIDSNFKEFNVRKMKNIQILLDVFEKDPNFLLKTYTEQGFGIFHSEQTYAVELCFAPEVAENVENYIFSPKQKMVKNTDGTISVYFETTGLKGLCQYLVKWEDTVRIISPIELKQEMESLLQKSSLQLR